MGQRSHLTRRLLVNRENGGLSEVENVAAVLELILAADGNDVVPFAPDVRAELHVADAQLQGERICWISMDVLNAGPTRLDKYASERQCQH